MSASAAKATETRTILPPIPAKRYFTIGEVSELCGVKPHVLRYWEQEFTQLRPMKRRGNRRYYQHHEVLLIRRIRELLETRINEGRRELLSFLADMFHCTTGLNVIFHCRVMAILDALHPLHRCICPCINLITGFTRKSLVRTQMVRRIICFI